VQLLIYNIIHPKIKSVDLPIYNHLTKGAVGYAHVTKEQWKPPWKLTENHVNYTAFNSGWYDGSQRTLW